MLQARRYTYKKVSESRTLDSGVDSLVSLNLFMRIMMLNCVERELCDDPFVSLHSFDSNYLARVRVPTINTIALLPVELVFSI